MAVSEARVWRVVAPPLHPFLMMIPATCVTAGLLTDIAYWSTLNTMWADFSAWIVSAAAILAWVVAIAGLIELLARPVLRSRGALAAYGLAYLAATVLATFNMLVHTRDVWASVVPWGLVLSALGVVAFLVAAAAAFVLVRPRQGGAA